MYTLVAREMTRNVPKCRTLKSRTHSALLPAKIDTIAHAAQRIERIRWINSNFVDFFFFFVKSRCKRNKSLELPKLTFTIFSRMYLRIYITCHSIRNTIFILYISRSFIHSIGLPFAIQTIIRRNRYRIFKIIIRIRNNLHQSLNSRSKIRSIVQLGNRKRKSESFVAKNAIARNFIRVHFKQRYTFARNQILFNSRPMTRLQQFEKDSKRGRSVVVVYGSAKIAKNRLKMERSFLLPLFYARRER